MIRVSELGTLAPYPAGCLIFSGLVMYAFF